MRRTGWTRAGWRSPAPRPAAIWRSPQRSPGRLERLAGLALFYGVFGADLDTASYRRFADGRFGLSRERMAYFLEQYDPTGRHRADPLLQPLLGELTGLPPTWLLAAGLDVLCSDTLALQGRLTEAGVRTTLHFEPGVVHGFINRGRMVHAARRSLDSAAHFLRSLTSDAP
ncbi:MAG: alpha/beta hydrolase fold domain-containing protein [Geminicoccaceae bacterium]